MDLKASGSKNSSSNRERVPKAVPGRLEWTFPRWALARGDISQSTLLIPIKTNSQEKKLVPRDPLFFTDHQTLLSCKGHTFFFFLYFLDFILLLFKKEIVTHNLHRKNQHSECEWFWGNNYKEISMKSWQTLNNSRGQNAWPVWRGIWGNLPK